jgi:hypothetical protein
MVTAVQTQSFIGIQQWGQQPFANKSCSTGDENTLFSKLFPRRQTQEIMASLQVFSDAVLVIKELTHQRNCKQPSDALYEAFDIFRHGDQIKTMLF